LRTGPDNGRSTQRFRDARAQAHLYLLAIFPDLKPMFGKCPAQAKPDLVPAWRADLAPYR
jgi:hypothetical protein